MAAAFSLVSSFKSSPRLHFSSPPPDHRRDGRLPITALQLPFDFIPKRPTSGGEVSTVDVQDIPGSYGLPIIGPREDRMDFFYNQGRDEFFRSRIKKYNSTVFRVNMPPGPPIAANAGVIALLDAKCFPALFDMDKVEKKDLFTGTYMPSTSLTGGYRVLSYLDPSEAKHTKLKNLIFYLISHRREHILPEFHNVYGQLLEDLEKEIAKNGKADFTAANDQAAFNFLGKAYYGVDPTTTKLGTEGPNFISAWLLFQLHPIMTLGLPSYIEDFLLHTAPLPPLLAQIPYGQLVDFFQDNAGEVLDEAARLGISRDEALHNLVFTTCFNTYGGMKVLFPDVIKWIGLAGAAVQADLAREIQSGIASAGGEVTMAAMEQMPLLKSVVYEALRINPPVPYQYGRAKKDFVVESHDAAYQVKKGEMLFGYQPLATNDPQVFDQPELFKADRFVGADGEALLKYLLWSNGPETDSPSISNKQCAGKDFVVLMTRLLVVEFFRRYDGFEVEVGAASALGSAINIKSFKPASS